METDKNYFLVGLFALAAIVAGFAFTLWLTSAGKGETVDYRIRFAESVSGLGMGSVVRFHGVDVGNVKKITIDPEDTRLILVDVRVLASAPVKSDTVASLQFLGISGDVYVELTGGSPNEPNLAKAAKDDEIPEIRSEKNGIGAAMDRLPEIAEKMDHLLAKLNHTADQVNKLFSDQNVKAVGGVVRKLSEHYGDKEPEPNPPPHQQR